MVTTIHTQDNLAYPCQIDKHFPESEILAILANLRLPFKIYNRID